MRLDICLLVGIGVLFSIERELLTVAAALRGEQIGNAGVLERPAQWPGHALHHGHTRQANQSPGDPVQGDEVGRIAHVVIAFDHQHLGKQLALREVPIRRQKTQIGWRIGRLVLTVVVILPVGRDEDRPDHDDGRTGRQDRHRPAHDARSDAPIQMRLRLLLRVEHSEKAAHSQYRWTKRHRGRDGE